METRLGLLLYQKKKQYTSVLEIAATEGFLKNGHKIFKKAANAKCW